MGSAKKRVSVVLESNRVGVVAAVTMRSSLHTAAFIYAQVTPQPKCALTFSGDNSEITRDFVDSYKLSEQSSTLLTLPLYCIHGLLLVLSTLTAGGNMVVVENEESKLEGQKIMQCISSLRTNWLTAESNLLLSLVVVVLKNCKDPKSSLKALHFVRYVGPALGGDLLQRISDFLGGPVLLSYGSAETCGLVATKK